MQLKKQIFIIVDAYTTGKYLAPMLIANGYECWHIQSCKDVISAYQKSFYPENFLGNYIYDGDVTKIINFFSRFQVKAVIPGAETGVVLADILSEKFQIPSNPHSTSMSRRNKYMMSKALEQHGVPVAKFLISNNLNEVLSWKNKQKLKKIVLKPIMGGGSDHVFIANSDEEISSAFYKILNEKDVFDQKNLQLLAQEFLEGQEYVINTISINKKHYIVDIWRKYKTHINGIPINDYSIAIDSTALEYKTILNYIYKVLNALDIYYGAAHTEIMLCKTGPILIETGARLAGSIDPSAVNEIYGTNHVKALIDSLIFGNEFTLNKNILVKNHGLHFFLENKNEGKIQTTPNFALIRKLSTFHSIFFSYDINQIFPKTTSLANFPGFGYLISENTNILMNEYKLLRQYENIIFGEIIKN